MFRRSSLEESATAMTWREIAIILALSCASGRWGVITPRSGSRPSAPRNRRSACRSAERRFGHVARQRVRFGAQYAARHDQPHRRDLGENHGDIQGVGDHVDRPDFKPANLLGDLGGGGAGIEDDRLAVLNQRRRGLGDAHLLRMVQGALDDERLIVVILAQQRAAVRAFERTFRFECRKISADGDRRGRESAPPALPR
jgi:hypothetical protein